MIIPFSGPAGAAVNPAKLRELQSRSEQSQRAMRAAIEAEAARRERAQVRIKALVAEYMREPPQFDGNRLIVPTHPRII